MQKCTIRLQYFKFHLSLHYILLTSQGVGHIHYQNMFHIQDSNSVDNVLCCYAYIAYLMTEMNILSPTILCDLYFFEDDIFIYYH